METWVFAISFATVISHGGQKMHARTLTSVWNESLRWSDPPSISSSLAACIKVLPVLTSTRVENYRYSLTAVLWSWPVC